MINAILARKRDQITPYLTVSGNTWPLIEARYEEIMAPAGEDFREKHCAISVIKDGKFFAYHEFETEEDRKTAEMLEAEAAHKSAAQDLERAQKRFDESKAAVDSLGKA